MQYYAVFEKANISLGETYIMFPDDIMQNESNVQTKKGKCRSLSQRKVGSDWASSRNTFMHDYLAEHSYSLCEYNCFIL